MRRLSPFFVFTLLSFCGCPPAPSPTPVTPTPDASDASPPTYVDAAPIPPLDDATPVVNPTPATACAAMARVPGCIVLSDCAATITKINAQPGFKHYDVACLSRATTAAGVVACGGSCGPSAK